MEQGRAVQRDNPSYAVETVSAVYADACESRGLEYYDSDDWEIPTSTSSTYEIVDWIGSGKYSDVFTAYKDRDYSHVVSIKVLKPVRQQKYNREVKILFNLKGGPNIVELIDVVQNPRNMQYSLVFEFIQEEKDFYRFIQNISPIEARFYLFQLMRAIQYAHSHGIMHRDIKPLNVLYDRKSKKLRLIDWGLAEFYIPGTRYGIHVASRNYKPIELLVDYQLYDYSIDIWSFGVTMAGMIFKQTPFFRGSTDMDMICKIVSVLGLDSFRAYITKYDIPYPEVLNGAIARRKPRPWRCFVDSDNRMLATDDALDLIDRCIRFDHQERITADEALRHPFFDPVRNIKAN